MPIPLVAAYVILFAALFYSLGHRDWRTSKYLRLRFGRRLRRVRR